MLDELESFWWAITNGYAIVIFGVVYLTPLGERYLARHEGHYDNENVSLHGEADDLRRGRG